MRNNLTALIILIIGGILFFAVGMFHQFIGLKALTLFVLLIIAGFVISLPTKWSIRILFIYIGFEGFAKIISSYNPIVHVGGDLLIVALCSKTLLLMTLGRLQKPEVFPPLTVLFGLHAFWYLVTLMNPYSLGIFPSLAASKLYITPLFLYFFAFYLCKDKREIKIIMTIWVCVTMIHTFVGLYQFTQGPQSVLNLHPGYASTLKKYTGTAFRPVGLTNLPGAPAIYIFLSTSFLLYFSLTAKNFIFRVLLFLAVPTWITLTLLCQIRSALLKSILAVIIVLGFYLYKNFSQFSKKSLQRIAIGVLATIALFFSVPQVLKTVETALPDATGAFERSFSLFEYDKISKARHSTLDRFIKYASRVPFGAGLSRIGAAGGKFRHLVNSPDDPFGNVFFADNFWIATVIDLGIPGMTLITILIFTILIRGVSHVRNLWPIEDQLLHICLLAGLLASGIGMYGAEAMLYNPEAAFFWFFSGALIRLHTNSKELKKQYFEKEREKNRLANLAHHDF